LAESAIDTASLFEVRIAQPFSASNSCLAKKAAKEIHSDIAFMRIRQNDSEIASPHLWVSASHEWPFEPQIP
jgi:hypothetical protein